jgi:hypothetical protein
MTIADDAPREEGPADDRPVSTRAAGGRSAPAVAAVLEPDIGVRPYFVTRGRTRTDRPLGIETLVETTPKGREVLDGLRFEQHAIALVCAEPVSVAEVAARVRVPIGVARVLVLDLAGNGLVKVHDAPTRIEDDISLIQRLIHGVREL